VRSGRAAKGEAYQERRDLVMTSRLNERKEVMMRLYPQFLRFLWKEEAPFAEVTGASAPQEVTGVPRLLQRAVRWSAIAVVGAAVLGQIIGVRLMAPVDAQTCYPAQCRQACLNSICGGLKGRLYLQCITSAAVRSCCATCSAP
jgi:hypothetical protein